MTSILYVTLGTYNVTSYNSWMRDLWIEMDVMVPSPSCDCDESSSYVEYLNDNDYCSFWHG